MNIKNLFIFGIGAAIGAAVTYKLVTDKYESLIEEEVHSVKESLGYYNRREKVEISDDMDNAKQDKNPKVYDPLKSDKKDYSNMVAYHKYGSGSGSILEEEEVEKKGEEFIEFHKIEQSSSHSFKDNIYVIPPNEYGAITDYDLIDLTHYNDGVLCDDMNEIVQDIDEKVGRDYIKHFGDFDEEDVIHVRNDILKCDYEITRDVRDYTDVTYYKPPHIID